MMVAQKSFRRSTPPRAPFRGLGSGPLGQPYLTVARVPAKRVGVPNARSTKCEGPSPATLEGCPHALGESGSKDSARPIRRAASNDVVLFLVGPTGVGTSVLALALAKKIGGEIVSCDSMQVYRGMNVGTDKASKAIQKKIPHHMIDLVGPSRPFNAAFYRIKALCAICGILRRKKVPIVVGGTGLYFRALLDGLFEGPGTDNRFRERLEKQARARGSQYLYQRLLRLDPAAAAKIHPNNTRKVIRALEVCHLARKPVSSLQKQGEGPRTCPYPFLIFGADMSREQLYRQINERVDTMFKRGLKEEVRRLCARGLQKNTTAVQAIGYKELIECLKGRCDEARAKELIARNSRRFAKRQFTWFKRDARIQWLKVDEAKDRMKAVKTILESLPDYRSGS